MVTDFFRSNIRKNPEIVKAMVRLYPGYTVNRLVNLLVREAAQRFMADGPASILAIETPNQEVISDLKQIPRESAGGSQQTVESLYE